MKNRILLTTILAVLLGMPCRHVVAQPEVRYPNPAYMHWEEPCAEYLGYNVRNQPSVDYFPIYKFGYSGDGTTYDNDHVCFVNPFGTGEGKLTLYGVAVSIIDADYYRPPYHLPDMRISLDILLYNFMPGDSNVQLVKRQTFVVDENQIPDLYMVYKALDGGNEFFPDTIVKYPMYEFYFDEPVEMYGDFYVGIHSMDTFAVLTGNMNCLGTLGIRDSSCCHSGYFGFIDMEREVLMFWDAYCFAADTYIGGGYYDGTSPGQIAPRTDTVFNNIAQGVIPITRPQGYLTATEPPAEVEVGSVRLSPNPARTRVTVEADCAIRHVEVADMAGRVLVSERYDAGARSATLDVGRLAQGIYAVRVYTEREEAVQKLIIE